MKNTYSIEESEMIQAIMDLGIECNYEEALAAYYEVIGYESSLD